MFRYINGKEFVTLARVRQAGPPFEDQNGNLVGVDYQDHTGGGMCNVRFTRQQAQALRDALTVYLQEGKEVEIVKSPDGTVNVVFEGKILA